jgi:hypothetical protein
MSAHWSSVAPSLEERGRQQAHRRRSTSQDFISVRPTIPTSSLSASTMLIGGTGQERTEADHRALPGEAGFSLTRVTPTAGPLSIIESQPA